MNGDDLRLDGGLAAVSGCADADQPKTRLEDMARAVLFLASHKSRHVNGAALGGEAIRDIQDKKR